MRFSFHVRFRIVDNHRFPFVVNTINLLKLVSMSQLPNCRSQFHCSIVSGDVSNCSYRLMVHPLTCSRISSAQQLFYTRKTPKNYREDRVQRKCRLHEPASEPSKRGGSAGHGRSIASDQPKRQQHERRQLRT